MKNAIIYTVIFAAIQIVVSFGVQGAYMLIYGPGARIDAMGMIITMAIFGVASLGAHPSVGSTFLVCDGCFGGYYSLYLVAGADA